MTRCLIYTLRRHFTIHDDLGTARVNPIRLKIIDMCNSHDYGFIGALNLPLASEFNVCICIRSRENMGTKVLNRPTCTDYATHMFFTLWKCKITWKRARLGRIIWLGITDSFTHRGLLVRSVTDWNDQLFYAVLIAMHQLMNLDP